MNRPLENSSPETQDRETHFVDFLIAVLKRKRLIGVVVCLAVLGSGVYMFLQPNMFTATARVLPPKGAATPVSGILSQAGGDLLSGLLSTQVPTDIYVGILQSRSVADRLIDQFGLQHHYGEKTLERTRTRLDERTAVKNATKDQIVTISVEDEDPELASNMANAYVQELDRINRIVNVDSGQLKRVFLEERLGKVREDLARAEQALKDFCERHGIVAVDEQAKAAVEGAAKIKGEIIAAETQLQVLKRFQTEKSNEVVSLRSRIAEMNRQLAMLEKGVETGTGAAKGQGSDSKSIFRIGFAEMPDLGMQLGRLQRETKVQEELFKLITAQYEMAKIEEAKDIKTVQVLDWAVPPDRKSGPMRSTVIGLSGVAGLFVAVFLSLVLDFVARLREWDSERYEQVVRSCRWKGPAEGLER